MESLGAAIVVFFISAAFVVAAGMGLARYGDDLAESTGWGKLWVGTLLVGIATSLPEVVVNISSVWLEKNPGLALGNVFGADMMNVFVLACVGLAFGVRNLFGGQGRDTELLILAGLGLVTLALVFGMSGDLKLGPTSLGGIVIFACYLAAMRMVYRAGQTHMHLADVPAPTGSARKAWIGFGISALVVIVAGRFLAASADAIAAISGIGASFIGVLLVSIVTTLPEASVTVAATLRKSYGIAMGNVYGSNVFNVTILSFSDLFSETPLLAAMEGAHYAAALGALALMGMGYLVWKGVQRPAMAWARSLAPAIPVVYVGVVYLVYRMAQG